MFIGKRVFEYARSMLSKKGDLRRFIILRTLAKFILPSYRFKWPEMAWWDDKEFNDYLARFNELDGMNTDRRWMLWQLLRLIKDVPGDTAECGVFKGAGSYLIALSNERNKEYPRTHHIFDSFEGLSSPSERDSSHWEEGDMFSTLAETKANLAGFANVRFYQGWIPDKFAEVEKARFSFVHVDVDLFQPTLDSVRFFYPRMNDGGILLCDDYGFTSCPGATKAIDEFLEDKPEKMISLSAGGGFLIKSRAVSRQ